LGGQLVVPRPLVRLAGPPLRLQPAALDLAMQRWIERAGLHLQEVVGLLADGLADAVAVTGAPLQRAEDEHVERALEQLEAAIFWRLRHGSRHSTAMGVERLRLFSTPGCERG